MGFTLWGINRFAPRQLLLHCPTSGIHAVEPIYKEITIFVVSRVPKVFLAPKLCFEVSIRLALPSVW